MYQFVKVTHKLAMAMLRTLQKCKENLFHNNKNKSIFHICIGTRVCNASWLLSICRSSTLLCSCTSLAVGKLLKVLEVMSTQAATGYPLYASQRHQEMVPTSEACQRWTKSHLGILLVEYAVAENPEKKTRTVVNQLHTAKMYVLFQQNDCHC